MKTSGVSLTLFVNKGELDNIKQGGSMAIAHSKRTDSSPYEITVPLDVCDIMADTEVRVNVHKIKEVQNALAAEVGESMGNAVQQAFAPIMHALKELG